MAAIVVEPAFQEVVLKRNEPRKEVFFRVSNNTNDNLQLSFYTKDFRQKDASGILSFIDENAGNYSYALASFISLESNVLSLTPGETKEVKSLIVNRADLSPGGHYGAIIMQATTENKRETSVLPSIASMLLVKKQGGERYALNIVHNSFPKNTVTFSIPKNILFTMQNEGNVHIIPYGTVAIHDVLGRQNAKGNINTSSHIIFPQSRREVPANLVQTSSSLPLSIHTLTVRGSDSTGNTQFKAQASSLYINPYFLLFSVISILGIVCFILWRRRKRKRKWRL